MNFLAHGDVLDVCANVPTDLRFDLVYLDPPYGVGTSMTARTAPGETRGKRRIEGGPVAYEDRYDPDALVSMLLPRLSAIRDCMREAATIYVHLDYRTVHHVKVAMDGLFGRGAYLGEVIWVPGNGTRGARTFAVTHQTLLMYARATSERKRVVYNASDPDLREPHAPTSLSMHFKRVDEAGRLYRERVIGGKAYRYYADQGRRMGSVWADIGAMVANTPIVDEGTGYPTQKPVRLLERIVRASSVEGSVVADLMCGSGTTLVAAARLARRFVGSDQSNVAVDITAKRLLAEKLTFSWLPGVSSPFCEHTVDEDSSRQTSSSTGEPPARG